MTGFSIRQKRLQAAGLIVCIHHPLQPAQPLCGSLPHSHWRGNLFGEADVPASSLQTSSCAVDELGTPGVFVFPALHTKVHSLSRSHFPLSLYLLFFGSYFPIPKKISVLECSISNDAPPLRSPLHPTHLHVQTIPPWSDQVPSPSAKSIAQVFCILLLVLCLS